MKKKKLEGCKRSWEADVSDRGDPRVTGQVKPRGPWSAGIESRPLSSLPPPCCSNWWISPLLPPREKVLALFFPQPVYVPHPVSKWPARPLSLSLYPGYKCGLRTPVQCRFCLELARCSNSISSSNKLFPSHSLSCLEILFQPAPGPR